MVYITCGEVSIADMCKVFNAGDDNCCRFVVVAVVVCIFFILFD